MRSLSYLRRLASLSCTSFLAFGLLLSATIVRGQSEVIEAESMHADGAGFAAAKKMPYGLSSTEAPRIGETQDAIFVGHVVDASGAALADAVVVTSAGGKAVTEKDGSFRLHAQLPPSATTVHVTAVAGSGQGSLVASTQLPVVSAVGAISTGTLTLQSATSCQPSWLPTFGGEPGVNGSIQALTVFDDGGGLALYAGGGFPTAGGATANGVAKWNGSSWSALGSGMGPPFGSPTVTTLTVFDDGSGPALYAGGAFTSAGGVPLNNVAKWNGTSWSGLGTGIVGAGTAAQLWDLKVFDDGSGPALYAAGEFATAGGVPANNVAKWSGSTWSALGTGVNSSVLQLTEFNDGSGPALYAGGNFTTAGGLAANRIAKWNGTSWSALGTGMNSQVVALSVFDDGSGPALYAGGVFSIADGLAASCIAKWNGSSWSQLGGGLEYAVYSLTVFDDGSGPALYAGGRFLTVGGVTANHIAKWNGTSWSVLGSGLGHLFGEYVRAMTVFDNGSGPALYAGGYFTTTGTVTANHIAQWNGSSWSNLGYGIDGPVWALAVFDDGNGPELYAGGDFTTVRGIAASRIARWNGSTWNAMGSGMNDRVTALTVFDDGTGPALYAGGYFTTAGGAAALHVAKWNGSSWSGLGVGTNNWVASLTVLDDGNGPALYAGGYFSYAGGVAANYIARWNGSSWTALGSGMSSVVFALTAFDDGSGPALYAGGVFTTAGGVAANYTAKWDGSSWSALGSGLDGFAFAMTVFDDGSGPALFVGGNFVIAGGVHSQSVAKWSGSNWTSLAGGMNNSAEVRAMTVFDDGSGPALFVGGRFSAASGVAVNQIAKWNGSSWSTMGNGVNEFVLALTDYDDGNGLALYAGGQFRSSPVGDSYLAKWGSPPGCVPPVTSFCFGDGTGTLCPCGNSGAPGNGCATSFNPLGANLSAVGVSAVSNDTLALQSTGLSNSTVTFFQGTTSINGGTLFGDGLRCAAGAIIRLGAVPASGGFAQYPSGAALPVSIRGAIPAAASVRHYQVWYRNAANFCTSSTFNLTNGLTVHWVP